MAESRPDTLTLRPGGSALTQVARRAFRRLLQGDRQPRRPGASGHRAFTLVLSGGGARGLAHAGVLRALEYYGWRPSAIVGVSMGAIVGTTYALNPDWYRVLVNMDTRHFPDPPIASSNDFHARLKALLASERSLRDMFLGWGVGSRSLEHGRALLQGLTQGRALTEGRIPLAVVAAELMSGQRVVLREGSAAEAVYASAALPGILPPLAVDGQLLADGAYVDLAPIDVAREFGTPLVIAVDARQNNAPRRIRNGFQAMVRAMEICQYQHAEVRFREADLVIRPEFPFPIDSLDFRHKPFCVAQGIKAVRRSRDALTGALHGRLRRR